MRRLIIIHSDIIQPAQAFVNRALMNTACSAMYENALGLIFPALTALAPFCLRFLGTAERALDLGDFV